MLFYAVYVIESKYKDELICSVDWLIARYTHEQHPINK